MVLVFRFSDWKNLTFVSSREEKKVLEGFWGYIEDNFENGGFEFN